MSTDFSASDYDSIHFGGKFQPILEHIFFSLVVRFIETRHVSVYMFHMFASLCSERPESLIVCDP